MQKHFLGQFRQNPGFLIFWEWDPIGHVVRFFVYGSYVWKRTGKRTPARVVYSESSRMHASAPSQRPAAQLHFFFFVQDLIYEMTAWKLREWLNKITRTPSTIKTSGPGAAHFKSKICGNIINSWN